MPDNCKDYQEIKVQEQVTRLAIGTIPRSITIILEDDLVDACKAGDDVKVMYVCFFFKKNPFSNLKPLLFYTLKSMILFFEFFF